MRRRHSLLIASVIVGMLAFFATHHPDLFIERTTSMTPLIKPGDLILGERLLPGQAPSVGQIAGYQYGDMMIAHRVIAAAPDGRYIFKGDANPTADPVPVLTGQIHEIVIGSIPLMGTLLEMLTRPLGIALVVVGILVAGAGMAWRQRHQVRARPTPARILEFRRRDDARERRAA